MKLEVSSREVPRKVDNLTVLEKVVYYVARDSETSFVRVPIGGEFYLFLTRPGPFCVQVSSGLMLLAVRILTFCSAVQQASAVLHPVAVGSFSTSREPHWFGNFGSAIVLPIVFVAHLFVPAVEQVAERAAVFPVLLEECAASQ